MLKQMLAITVAVAAISLATPGTGGANATCNPYCAPYPSSNSGGESRGLTRANAVSPDHGADGRAIAAAKQSGESNVVNSGGGENEVPPAEPIDVVEPTEGGNPCSGC